MFTPLPTHGFLMLQYLCDCCHFLAKELAQIMTKCSEFYMVLWWEALKIEQCAPFLLLEKKYRPIRVKIILLKNEAEAKRNVKFTTRKMSTEITVQFIILARPWRMCTIFSQSIWRVRNRFGPFFIWKFNCFPINKIASDKMDLCHVLPSTRILKRMRAKNGNNNQKEKENGEWIRKKG